MNQAPASGTKFTTASAATCASRTANAEYTTAAPSAAATPRASAIDRRRGRPRTEKYTASPSRMPNGNEAAPGAVTIPAATVTTPSTGSGQRRRTTTEDAGQQRDEQPRPS